MQYKGEEKVEICPPFRSEALNATILSYLVTGWILHSANNQIIGLNI